jgi:uncharacterized protein YlxW (UPF0749 family)
LGSVDFQTKRHIFAAPEVARVHSKSDLRRMVENIDTTGAKVVGIHQQRIPNQRG